MFSIKQIIKILSNTNFYGLRKRLHQGIRLYLMPTFDCTLDCFYCSTKMVSGEFPQFKQADFDTLIYEVNNFFLPVREVVISGGEPFLYPRIDELINFLTAKYFVTVQSNMSVLRNAEKIIPSSKLLFSVSFHPSELKKEVFEKNVNKLKGLGHRVIVVDTEGTNEVESDVTEYLRDSNELKDQCLDIQRWVIAPNGKKFCTFGDMFRSVSKINPAKIGAIDNEIYKFRMDYDSKSEA